jgi:hypothetical protein
LNAGETEAFAKTVETEHSCSLSVQIGPKETLFVKPSDLPAGAVPDVSLRLHDGAIVARLLYQLFVMSRVVDIDGSGLVFHAPNGGQYISVMLSEGQTVAVDPHSLAAYTSSVHFDRHWDFNIAVVGLDRIFYLLAKGPGMLVMRCNGGPVISTDAEEMPSVPMERMLLFDAKSSFRALASDGALNHILSACVLKPERGGIFVAGPVSAHHHTGLGRLWKFIKHCYVPI